MEEQNHKRDYTIVDCYKLAYSLDIDRLHGLVMYESEHKIRRNSWNDNTKVKNYLCSMYNFPITDKPRKNWMDIETYENSEALSEAALIFSEVYLERKYPDAYKEAIRNGADYPRHKVPNFEEAMKPKKSKGLLTKLIESFINYLEHRKQHNSKLKELESKYSELEEKLTTTREKIPRRRISPYSSINTLKEDESM